MMLATLSVLLFGCAHTPRLSMATRDAIYERASLHFEQTVLLKPDDSERPEFQLAPLIVQQVLSTNNVLAVPNVLYFWRTFARLGSQPMEQFNYVWFYAKAGDQHKTPQGVRITFGEGGRPILWEILRDDSCARILFVSQTLEATAMTNFPAPLPGRRFWIERAVSEDPDTVVARIIDDSATVMGPTLYLEAGSHEVGTLICRCMDAQATEVAATGNYRLARMDEAAVRWLARNKTPGITRWLPGKPADDLTQWLRVEPR